MDRIRILFVDDSGLQISDFCQSLAGGDYDVTTASSIAEAKRAVTEQRFDIAVIDYHLGNETGDACLRELRRATLEQTRYFLYTTDADAFRQHRTMGFDGVLMLKGKSSVRLQIDAIARWILRVRAE
jgi:CheY-like chemotaxis protein